MDLLATQFELNSMRNIFLSLSQYSTCLTAGCLPNGNKWRENLMNLYARISLCRTVNRSLDYCACLSRVRKYGLGKHVMIIFFLIGRDYFNDLGFNFIIYYAFINVNQ